ncbi:MAG: DUF512 domain-containing protein [candidate division Zixibacteria bacterium CG_4_9_14_3_um_filter_46_8]|nr:MAG: DUF512 domain-containing protein [candidate division Zixibacteria bacterium CG_4_9_14_3_um_filter_46_8]
MPAESKLMAINRHIIRDALDYAFHSADEELEILIECSSGESRIFEVHRESGDDIGMEFAPDKIRCCGNKCIFCFIDQLPQGLRPSLYIKDEDYRLSFLGGNFITLTSVTESDLKRIIRYHLSPLYVSVHTTNEELRKSMLGRKKIRPVLETLTDLAEAEIEIHAQIVLCPGYNDGDELERTISELETFRPFLKSVGIVPVGLSSHRAKLPILRSVDRDAAERTIASFGPARQRQFRLGKKDGFVYLADELFLMIGAQVPEVGYYDNYPQYENGIGMVRSLLDDFEECKQELSAISDRRLEMTFITGKLMMPVLNQIVIPEINNLAANIFIRVLPVGNRLLGDSITVSGLLSGNDIINSYAEQKVKSGLIILPPNCINTNGLLLDDHTPNSIAQRLRTAVSLGTYNIVETLVKAVEGIN